MLPVKAIESDPIGSWKKNSQRMNKSEGRMLKVLRKLGVRIVSQVQVGPYSVDFLLPDYQVLIELDGPQFHSLPDANRRDRRQDGEFQRRGFLVIHVWTTDLYKGGDETKILKHIVTRMYRERGIVLPIRNKSKSYSRLYRDLGLPD
jgi:very-short-patch-repair endonuclease